MGKIEDLLVNKGLYAKIEICIDDLDEIKKYLSKNIYARNTIDCYCVHCETQRIFEYADSEVHNETGLVRICSSYENRRSKITKKEQLFSSYLNKRYALTYRCTRDMEHTILFDLIVTDNQIIKIGQFPSVADLSLPKIEKYKSVLDKTLLVEFNKAIGLDAHEIGIGAFVYLRRIIEKLVFDKYERFSNELNISAKDFKNMRFEDKIDLLKDHLPSILIDNKNVYGILSKGIHELSEAECKDMFPIVKIGIELILDEMLAEKERKTKEKGFSKFVADKTGELRSR